MSLETSNETSLKRHLKRHIKRHVIFQVGISRDDAGTYRCSVTSNKQLRSSGDVVVTVMGKTFTTSH